MATLLMLSVWAWKEDLVPTLNVHVLLLSRTPKIPQAEGFQLMAGKTAPRSIIMKTAVAATWRLKEVRMLVPLG